MNVLFGAAVMFVGLVFYGFSCDVRRWWDEAREARETVRMSDAIALEDERMETLRRQLDELWEDDEDPRAAFDLAAIEWQKWVKSL